MAAMHGVRAAPGGWAQHRMHMLMLGAAGVLYAVADAAMVLRWLCACVVHAVFLLRLTDSVAACGRRALGARSCNRRPQPVRA